MLDDFKAIDELSPDDFELFVRDVFVAAGWTDAVITEVGKEYKSGDGGVDIFAYKKNRKFAIEVKQRKAGSTVDVKALNQLVTGAQLANANNMILVTNSYFTSEVKIRSLRLGVELIDREALQDLWIQKHSEIARDIKPRTYQKTVISECIEKFNSGKSKLLIEMATGLGKTYTIALIIKQILQTSKEPKRVLLIAHQVELLMQAVTAFKNVLGIGTYTYSACFGGSDPEDTDFVFATFDTLFTKIHALDNNSFEFVIVDEAHHVAARTYAQVVEHFNPDLLIGLTATPYRTDNQDVLRFFGGADGHVGKYDLSWALRHNKLAFPKYVVLLDDLDQARLDQLEQGISISDLDKRLFLHKKDEEVVKIIEQTVTEKDIRNPKGIVFCRSINHINHLIQFFEFGSATLVHSKMSDLERRNNIRTFREGDHRFILVCDLFNEGIDIPETNLLVFMRYTASRLIWLQQLGRGLRKTPNKDYVHVLDFVGSLARLHEVERLKRDVSNIATERDNWEPSPREAKGSVVHDATLDVTYNQSAAQVLKLVEELEYRLRSRESLLGKLYHYYETHNELPAIDNIEQILEDVTADQISTHFDSYYNFVESALPDVLDVTESRSRLQTFVDNFQADHGITPSMKAISQGFKVKSLLEFTSAEITNLVGPLEEFATDTSEVSDAVVEAIEQNAAQQAASEAEESEDQKRLLMRYAGEVKNPHDMTLLNKSERAEIKKYFRSDFYFLKRLRHMQD